MKPVAGGPPPVAPPAIWVAFERQGAWKNWVIVLLVGLNALLVIAGARLAQREPDVVLVAADGTSTYLPNELAGAAVANFLREQRHMPSDVTIVHFCKDFLHLAFAINSSTIEEAWFDALALMTPELRAKSEAEAKSQKLVERYKVTRVRTELTVEDLRVLERTSTLIHLQAAVVRRQGSLLTDEAAHVDDRLNVELVLRVVPRTSTRPDGLEVAALNVSVAKAKGAEAKGDQGAPAAGAP
jgi:hypothetical protein